MTNTKQKTHWVTVYYPLPYNQMSFCTTFRLLVLEWSNEAPSFRYRPNITDMSGQLGVMIQRSRSYPKSNVPVPHCAGSTPTISARCHRMDSNAVHWLWDIDKCITSGIYSASNVFLYPGPLTTNQPRKHIWRTSYRSRPFSSVCELFHHVINAENLSYHSHK